MFSSTTMASSMTIPTTRASASRVIVFSVRPSAAISVKVAMIDVGIARAAMSVERQFHRKTSTTSAARMEPMTRCSCTAWVEASTNTDWSRTIRRV